MSPAHGLALCGAVSFRARHNYQFTVHSEVSPAHGLALRRLKGYTPLYPFKDC